VLARHSAAPSRMVRAAQKFGPPSLAHCAIMEIARNMNALEVCVCMGGKQKERE